MQSRTSANDSDPNRDRQGAVTLIRRDRSLTVAVRIMLFLPAASCFAEDKAITLYVSSENMPNALPSLTAARNSIREHRGKGEWKDVPITVRVRAGQYFLDEPLTLATQ